MSYIKQLQVYAENPNIMTSTKDGILFYAKVVHLLGIYNMSQTAKKNLLEFAQNMDQNMLQAKLEDTNLSNE